MIKIVGLLFSLCVYLGLLATQVAMSQPLQSQFKHWQKSTSGNDTSPAKLARGELAHGKFQVDENQLRTLLLSQPSEHVISIPLPNGSLVDFILSTSQVMAPELAVRYPQIKTFTGVQVDNPHNRGRFDITPHGFHGMFWYQGERVFIEPETVFFSNNVSAARAQSSRKSSSIIEPLTRDFSQQGQYLSYQGKNNPIAREPDFIFHPPKVRPHESSPLGTTINASDSQKLAKGEKSAPSQSAITTYRLAIATAAEYTQFNGGNVDSAMAEIVTLVNRLNEVYQRDLAIKLELVANNHLLVFTNPTTDPYANTSDDGEVNTQVINNIIGSDNYDIGHVVGTGGGGLAFLGVVCNSQNKGDGVTGSSVPNNDAFYIDYVAHEIGHQFGAEHTFNGNEGACAGNRVANSAYEVGSGSTIMSYAGICGSQNLQNNSDAFFHSVSIDEINTFINAKGDNECGSVSGLVNNTAIVDAGADFTIPARTPFVLQGSATDVDSTGLSYSWQQFDLGTASNSSAEQVDDGSRPLFRAWPPISHSNRTLPKLDNLLNNTNALGEVLPSTNRALNFRLLVRDGEGGVSFDTKTLTVVDTSTPFGVLSPASNEVWSTNTHTVTWEVAQTHSAPINCSSVDILLSADGGNNFSHTLAANVANNGRSDVNLAPFCVDDINTSRARVKVACSDNIFFAVNHGDFNINKTTSASELTINNQQVLSINQGESLTITSTMFSYTCAQPTSISISAGNNYTVSGNTVTPDNNFLGTLTIEVTAHRNGQSSTPFLTTISVIATVEDETPTDRSSGSVYWMLLSLVLLGFRRGKARKRGGSLS